MIPTTGAIYVIAVQLFQPIIWGPYHMHTTMVIHSPGANIMCTHIK